MQFKGRSIVDLRVLTAEKVAAAPSAAPKEITALKPGLRDPSRVNIYINHKFLCSLSLSQFNQAELKLHQILTDADCEQLVSLSNYGKLYQRALEWACVRPRSEKEAHTYLINKKRRRDLDWRRYETFLAKYRSDPEFKAKVDADRERVRNLNERARSTDFTENNTFEYAKHYQTHYPKKPAAPISDQDIAQVIRDLYAAKLLDDRRFAEFYVEARKSLTGISRRRLVMELRNKGVSAEIIEQVLAASPRQDDDEIRKMILNKRRRYPDDEKMLAYLVRQGFSFQEARAGLANYQCEFESEEADF